jgi:purine-binding chemotaxis protein CheW
MRIATENKQETRGSDLTFWLMCRAGSRLCALPIEHVIETMPILPIEQLAGGAACVCGLCIIRGEPVLVIDAAVLLFAQQPDPCERLITMRTGTRTIALAMQAVLGVQPIDARLLCELPPLLCDAVVESIAAVVKRDAELAFVLRAGRLIPDDIIQHLKIGTLNREFVGDGV